MGKIILLVAMSLMSVQSIAAIGPKVLSVVVDQDFGVISVNDSLYCTTYDSDNDGVAETDRVTLYLGGSVLNGGLGVLQNPSITNEFVGAPGEACEKVALIKKESPMSFGAMYGKYDSTLTLEPARLVEYITVNIEVLKTLDPFPGGTVDERAMLTLTAEVSKDLTIQ